MSVLVRPYDFLLDGAVGWDESLTLGTEAGAALTLRRQPSTGGAIDTAAAVIERLRPKGVVALRDTVYVADDTRGVVWTWAPCCPLHELPEVGAEAGGRRRVGHPAALAVRNGSDLVVLDARAATLHVFTIPDLALRRVVGPALRSHPPLPGGDWEPIDVAVAPDGSLLLADRRSHVWRLDFQLRPDRYFAGALPAGTVPTRIEVDHEGYAHVADTGGGVSMLDPRGVLVPGPDELDDRSLAWVEQQYPVDDDPLPSDAFAARHVERLRVARRALLPGDLAHRLEVATDLDADPVDWSPGYQAVLPGFVAERLGGARLVPDRDGVVSLLAERSSDTSCSCPPLETELVIDRTGALDLGEAAVEHVLRLVFGSGPPSTLGSQPLEGIIAVLIELVGVAGHAHLDPVFDRARRDAALHAIGHALAVLADAGTESVTDPHGEAPQPPDCPDDDPLVEPVDALARWLHPASLTDLVAAVVDRAVLDASGRPVLGPDALASIVALAATLTVGGPPLTAPPDDRPFVRQGVVQLSPLDAGVLGNVWHRVVVDQTLPQRTSAQVFAFTSDVDRPDVSAEMLIDAPEQHPWRSARVNASEWLVQCPPGRFLHLAMVLKGTDDLTPVISSITVYRTRSSSLGFLPAAYRHDPESASALDRLLSLTDTIFHEIETVIDDFPRQLAAASADPEFLPWLASWFDLTFDPSWDDGQRRRILASVVELYRWRGTKRGLTMLLELHTGLEGGLPRLVENRCARGSSELEEWVDAADPCAFTVLLPAEAVQTAEDAASIDRVLRGSIPAHTDFCLRPVVPGVRLRDDAHAGSVVGFDTLVGGVRRWRLPHDPGWPGSRLGRGLPDDPVSRSRGIRVGGPGYVSRVPPAPCSHEEDRS